MASAFAISPFVQSPSFLPSSITKPRAPRSPYTLFANAQCVASPSSKLSADVVVIGGGLAAFSTAFELAQFGVRVRIVTDNTRRLPGGMAAAGMLAPNAEGLTDPLMLDMCRLSLDEFGPLVSQLSDIVSEVNVDYRPHNNFLLPCLQDDQPIDPSPGAKLIRVEPQNIEPLLNHDNMASVHRCLDDASIDSRALLQALRMACERLGVVIHSPYGGVTSINPKLGHIQLAGGRTGQLIHAGHFVVCAGSWTSSLLPMIPMKPVKGQMLSLVPPSSSTQEPYLHHVLFGRHCYIVPKELDDKPVYFVGATVEDVGFSSTITAAGVASLLKNALDLVPHFRDFQISDTWSGLRSSTPDLLPVLGNVPEYGNVSVASGFLRNGVLLTPITGRILAAVALGNMQSLSAKDQNFLSRFSCNRFCDGTVTAESTVDGQRFGQVQTTTASQPNGQRSQTDVKMYKILKDGSKEAVHAPPGWSQLSQRGKNEKKEPQIQRQDIKINKILDDGSREAVVPAVGWPQPASEPKDESSVARNQQAVVAESPFSTLSSSQGEVVEETGQSIVEGQNDDMSKVTTVKLDERSIDYKEEVDNGDNVSAVNDAYDDVIANRNRSNVEEHEKLARSMNRTFGRTPSYLENGTTARMSLSQEEVERYDEAVEQAMDEMKVFTMRFDPSDPSVKATQRDLHLMDLNEKGEGSVPSTNGSMNGTTSSEEHQFSTDGYF